MLAELVIIPVGGDVSISADIAKAIKAIEESGLEYRITSMGTVIEGSLNEILNVVEKCFTAVYKDRQRLMITLSLDDRKDKEPPRMEQKIASVEQKVGKKLKR